MLQKVSIIRGLKFGDGKTRIAIWINMTIEHQKAMISLNKYERCLFQSQALRLCVLQLPGKLLYSAVLIVKPAARERICIFNKPICYFCYIVLNVNQWIGKKLMHYKNLNN